MKRKITVSILAHVDAGKTTLSEALLYTAGAVRSFGRVDNGDCLLDYNSIERKRGVTVFSKQAVFETAESVFYLLDTPGHSDFTNEALRTLSVCDAAVLCVSATDGVQAHTSALWKLLENAGIPVFIFITKTDLPHAGHDALLSELTKKLSGACVDYTQEELNLEEIAELDEAALEEYLSAGDVPVSTQAKLFSGRKLFPCIFGSGLRLTAVDRLISCMDSLIVPPSYSSTFSARVYKIMRDGKNNRLTCMKITGGTLNNRDVVNYCGLSEKITEIRIYRGPKSESVDSVSAGDICAVRGLTATKPGQLLGAGGSVPGIHEEEAYTSCTLEILDGTDPGTAYKNMCLLAEEEPGLSPEWLEQTGEINLRLMGKLQTEVLCSVIKERFDMDVRLGKGRIIYKETVTGPVEGIGHYEPLRHYAEVHVAIEPLPRGSGVRIFSVVSEDELDRNWQNLILTNLGEKKHLGVLTGSELTDVSITLIAARAHLKHTEGGDFREASYRAVRQGLMNSESVLLEPWLRFKIITAPDKQGRVINDLRRMSAEIGDTVSAGEEAETCGIAPASEIRDYCDELVAFTSGRGRISLESAGYYPCHNAEDVIAAAGYNPERDIENTPDSVFCSHGAGMNVKWDKVPDYAHISTGYGKVKPVSEPRVRSFSIDDEELEAIMTREFGPISRPQYSAPAVNAAPQSYDILRPADEYLIIDGYNVIFADDGLKKLSEESLDHARDKLCERLKSYRAFRDCRLVLVFDGYKVKGSEGEKDAENGVFIVYTKENETADMYIEKLVHDIGKNYSVRVVTGDSLIRLSAMRSGVLRQSSAEFLKELEDTEKRIKMYLK